MNMTLSDLNLSYIYDKKDCNVADNFYLPCMRAANRYDRLTGYFSSGIYIIAWEALQEFIENNGKIRIICSPHLSNEDRKAMLDGFDSQNNEKLSKYLLSEFDKQLLNPSLSCPAKLLACLISKNILDIHLAVMSNNALFHDKVGVFEDNYGNLVGFRGTMNETYNGLASDGNGESIDVYWNWSESESDLVRANEAKNSFESLWNNRIQNVCVYDLPSSIKKKFLEISQQENFEELLYKVIETKKEINQTIPFKKPRKHQKDALDDWDKNNRRGLLEHATGSGKTFTAICAIRDSLEKGEIPFILVPSVELLQQWHIELKDSLNDISPSIFLCGGGNSKWKQNLTIITSSSPNIDRKRIILAVMATASTKEFLEKFRGGKHIFFVADEVHRLGSPKYSNTFTIKSGPRLGLSATPERFGDRAGTELIFSYFERVINPVYTLKDAISDGVLTEYKYFPKTVVLTKTEQDEWDEYTLEIKQKIAILKNSKANESFISNKKIKNLLIARSRVIKRAQNKVNATVEIISNNYKSGQKWIVYCDSIEQIHLLMEKLHSFPVLEYHSKLDSKERHNVMQYFNTNGGLVFSVKCLDEGVDIPSVSHALIIASSKNSREFIQRRGRVLRKAKGKHIAYVHDLIVLPYKAKTEEDSLEDVANSIIEAELARAILFGEGSSFPKCVADLNNIALDFHININNVRNLGYDDENEE